MYSIILESCNRALVIPFISMVPLSLVQFRLLFEARNQKKEAKEMAVIQAMKRQEEEKSKERAKALL